MSVLLPVRWLPFAILAVCTIVSATDSAAGGEGSLPPTAVSVTRGVCAGGVPERPASDPESASLGRRPTAAEMRHELQDLFDGRMATREVISDIAAGTFGPEHCWAALSAIATLAAKDWQETREALVQVLAPLEPGARPCIDEARQALTLFNSAPAFHAWLSGHGLGGDALQGRTVVSVRHALYELGRVYEIDSEISAQPPVRPVDGILAIATLAPELFGARFSDDHQMVEGCSLLPKPKSVSCDFSACYRTVRLMASHRGRCFTLSVRALACWGDMMSPYVGEQVQLLNAMLAERKSPGRFAFLDGGLNLVFASAAGLRAAKTERLLPDLDFRLPGSEAN